MSEIISINEKPVPRIIYRNKPVVSCPMVDDIHGKSKGHTSRTFRDNKHRLVEGKHYFTLTFDEWNPLVTQHDALCDLPKKGSLGQVIQQNMSNDPPKKGGGYAGDLVFLTSIGYTMLVKVFDDDLSWQIYETMVDNYFNPAIQRDIKIPSDPEQKWATLAWVRQQKKNYKVGLKWAADIEKAIIQGNDNSDWTFVLPSSNQLTLGM